MTMNPATANVPQKTWAVVYEVGRNYGGPEEGGWWYDTGKLIQVVICQDEAEAEFQCALWRKAGYSYTGKRSSVLGGEDYDCYYTTEEPEPFFPTERPHYE
jgi:hypothetical protein